MAAGLAPAVLTIGGCAMDRASDSATTAGTVGTTTRPGAFDSAQQMVAWFEIGRSHEGRPIEAATIGPGGEPRLLVIGGIHGDEVEAGGAVIDRLAAALLLPESRLESGGTIRLIRDMNPDGAAAGTRGNARGIDLNRNWPATNFRASRRHGEAPLSERETQIAHREIVAFGPEVLIVLHSIGRGPFVNYDGPAALTAALFSVAAAESAGTEFPEDGAWHVRSAMGYATPGSLGTWAGVEGGLVVLTIEFERGHDPAAAARELTAGVHAVLALHRVGGKCRQIARDME